MLGSSTECPQSLAIINSNGVLSEINMIKEEKPSEKLIELIEKSLRKANLDLHGLDCIAVGVGVCISLGDDLLPLTRECA